MKTGIRQGVDWKGGKGEIWLVKDMHRLARV